MPLTSGGRWGLRPSLRQELGPRGLGSLSRFSGQTLGVRSQGREGRHAKAAGTGLSQEVTSSGDSGGTLKRRVPPGLPGDVPAEPRLCSQRKVPDPEVGRSVARSWKQVSSALWAGRGQPLSREAYKPPSTRAGPSVLPLHAAPHPSVLTPHSRSSVPVAEPFPPRGAPSLLPTPAVPLSPRQTQAHRLPPPPCPPARQGPSSLAGRGEHFETLWLRRLWGRHSSCWKQPRSWLSAVARAGGCRTSRIGPRRWGWVEPRRVKTWGSEGGILSGLPSGEEGREPDAG